MDGLQTPRLTRQAPGLLQPVKGGVFPVQVRPHIMVLLVLQATKDLIARVFRLQTEVSRLRRDVTKLGGPRDTTELRHKVSSTD